ncbi:MAG: thioredoxin domain-containing protein [Phycisphaerae bacterium]|nr:thioredoxin domain-containing protein [Phycisphaerae bacterium]
MPVRMSRAAMLMVIACAVNPTVSSGDPRARATSMNAIPATKPTHTNRLIHATSPYLLQHAHNPVDWYEWGPEAFDTARREGKPIFLSIGYSACHWCHVMERESFESETIAAILNADFVSIKVDREERPDVDDLYMKATLLFNQGQGGWPMSVFLTPDRRPFFAGTYFPPESRWGRPGFRELLELIARTWKEDRGRVMQGAESLTEAVRRYATVTPGQSGIPHETLARTVAALAQAFDSQKGGISGGGTNKFPPSMAMDLMLRAYHLSLRGGPAGKPEPRRELLQLVETTLDHMARGGIYDHLAGGIARYSTDVDWLVPHFEKMLYDQALVAGIYLDAFQLTKDLRWAGVARDICDYVIADLQSPQGGYYSARDADSEGVEGKYYVWSKDEVMAVLGADDGTLFCSYYDVSDAGNWEGRNILHVPRSIEGFAKLHRIAPADAERRLTGARAKLLAHRARRIPPHLDDKVLAAWNGLMIASMARAYRVLDEPRFRDSAVRAADFVLTKMRHGDRLRRSWRDARATIDGYLDDYAFMIEALLYLYEATFEPRWLDEAERLTDVVRTHFRDADAGGFFFTPADGEHVLIRAKEAQDGAIPSGNSVMLMNLLRLSVLRNRKDLRDDAEALMRCFADRVAENPTSSERLLAAVDFHHRRPREIVLIAPQDGPEFQALVRTVWQTYLPNRVIVGGVGEVSAESAKRVPLLAGRRPKDGRATAFVCENFTCKAPTTDALELARQLVP